jgi:hypothetical protein
MALLGLSAEARKFLLPKSSLSRTACRLGRARHLEAMSSAFRYAFPTELFDQAPKPERVGYLMLGQLWNDTIILTKQMLLARNKPPGGRAEHDLHAQAAIELLNLRMLASRLHEGAGLMKKLGLFLKDWKKELEPGAVAAADNLRKYFSNGAAPLSRLRNKMGFHQDQALAEEALETLGEPELIDYHGEHYVNTIYMSAEALNLRGLAHLLVTETAREALNLLAADALKAMSWTYEACQGYHSWFLQKHIVPHHPFDLGRPISLDKALVIDEVRLPFFLNIEAMKARVDERGSDT